MAIFVGHVSTFDDRVVLFKKKMCYLLSKSSQKNERSETDDRQRMFDNCETIVDRMEYNGLMFDVRCTIVSSLPYRFPMYFITGILENVHVGARLVAELL